MAHSFLRAGRLVDASKKHNKQVEVDWWRHKDKKTTTTLSEGHTEMPLVLINPSPQLSLQLSNSLLRTTQRNSGSISLIS